MLTGFYRYDIIIEKAKELLMGTTLSSIHFLSNEAIQLDGFEFQSLISGSVLSILMLLFWIL